MKAAEDVWLEEVMCHPYYKVSVLLLRDCYECLFTDEHLLT